MKGKLKEYFKKPQELDLDKVNMAAGSSNLPSIKISGKKDFSFKSRNDQKEIRYGTSLEHKKKVIKDIFGRKTSMQPPV